ncbi:MAG: molybdopterin-dependent oxidoreductase [Elusimicrobiota bacterium]
MNEKPTSMGLTRRAFLQSTAFLGGSALLSPMLDKAGCLISESAAAELAGYDLADANNYISTVCLQCNTGCGIKAKIIDGVVVKIDGNPYSPWTMFPHPDYKTSLAETEKIDGALCAKGQSGMQTAYDPYRITKVLKRAGKRGENNWVTIDFQQAVNEIVEGGKLFKSVPGEEGREVEGLRDLYALKDQGAAKSMAADAKKVGKKKMQVFEFKRKWADYLDTLIDPDKPDLGPKNNQFVFVWGRLKGGRGDVIKRFTGDSFGSVNAIGHTTVCQGSLYFTGKAMSEQWAYDEKDKKVKWTGGDKFFWEADDANAEFVLYIGVNPTEGNYLTYRTPRIMDGLASGRLKFAVVDPRFSTLAGKAWKWVPSKPGSEGALGLALIRWIIDNKRYDATFLANANKAAATADKESTWCNASWLVKIDDKGHAGEFLRGSEIGVAPEIRKDKEGMEYDFDRMVVMAGAQPKAFDPDDEKSVVEGELLYEGTVNGHRVKTAFLLLTESASQKTIAQWAEICGVDAKDLEELAREFTSHGKKAVADIHRGVSQHTNGYYNSHVLFTLNLLVGNYDHQGGLIKAGTYDYSGGKAKGPFNYSKLHPVKLSPFGTPIIRNEKYEDSTLFAGYPAKRPWFPLASDIYQEIVPSIGDAYPYPVKAMILYMGSPVYALPAGNTNISVLKDPAKLPLFIASDIVIGETSLYADYIFPDLTFLERWEFQGSHPTVAQKAQPVRQPAIAPLVETVKVAGREMPICLESMLIAVALKLELSGFGKDGLKDGMDYFHPDDLYLRLVANLAFGEKEDGSDAVPDASEKEMEIFRQARRHLPKSVYEEKRWKKIVGADLWPKVVYVLNRGGRFMDQSKTYKGGMVANKYGKLAGMYCEKTATTKDSMTGKKFHGIATYVPAGLDCLGRELDESAYPLTLITHRRAQHTKSRTVSNYWLLDVQGENDIQINPIDAKALGLKDGDLVKVVSSSNPKGEWQITDQWVKTMTGSVLIDPGIRPGVVTFSLGMGHWMYGSTDVQVDGKTIKGDARRGKGVHANAAMPVDPHLKNVCLSDSVGASAVFYDSRVRLEKV